MEQTFTTSEMEVIIKDFRENLVREFIVGGSFALVIAGGFKLPIGDIDIEVEESQFEDLKKMRTLEAATPKFTKNYSEGARIDFIFKGVKFNAFIVPKHTRSFVWKDYVKYSTVMAVINHKKAHARVKDFKSINTMALELLLNIQVKEQQI